jgi:hypothetical protein
MTPTPTTRPRTPAPGSPAYFLGRPAKRWRQVLPQPR